MLFLTCVVILVVYSSVDCVKTVPERASVLYNDTKEYEFSKLYVTRHGRKSDYYLNYETNVLRPQNNNITIHLIFYELLHNEYRRSFVEMQFKLCDFIDKEAYVGGMMKDFGLRCPLYGQIHMLNISFPTKNMPYVLPFQKFRVDMLINKTDSYNIFYGMVWAHFARK